MVARYGVEVEGPFIGAVTLILPRAAWHNVETVEMFMHMHPEAQRPTHLWIELQPGELFHWGNVLSLLQAGYRVTAQVREPEDVPPVSLLDYKDFGVVWMVPKRFREIFLACSHIKWANAPGDGCDTEVQLREFNPADYAKDQEWQLP
jgi:hypothetical protein